MLNVAKAETEKFSPKKSITQTKNFKNLDLRWKIFSWYIIFAMSKTKDDEKLTNFFPDDPVHLFPKGRNPIT